MLASLLTPSPFVVMLIVLLTAKLAISAWHGTRMQRARCDARSRERSAALTYACKRINETITK